MSILERDFKEMVLKLGCRLWSEREENSATTPHQPRREKDCYKYKKASAFYAELQNKYHFLFITQIWII